MPRMRLTSIENATTVLAALTIIFFTLLLGAWIAEDSDGLAKCQQHHLYTVCVSSLEP